MTATEEEGKMGLLLIRDIYRIWYDSDGYIVYYIPNHNAIILVMMEGKLMVDFYLDEWSELCKCADSIELPTDLPDCDLITIYDDDKHLFRASNRGVCWTLIERKFTINWTFFQDFENFLKMLRSCQKSAFE